MTTASSYELRTWEQFVRMGARVSGVEPENSVGQPDFVVWLPKGERDAIDAVGPMLVEVAGRLARPGEKQRQLREMLDRSGYLIGILVLDAPAPPRWNTTARSAILTIGFEQLAVLEPSDFAHLMRQGRNDLFHGKWPS